MDLDRTLLEIGGSPVTLLHLLLVAGLFSGSVLKRDMEGGYEFDEGDAADGAADDAYDYAAGFDGGGAGSVNLSGTGALSVTGGGTWHRARAGAAAVLASREYAAERAAGGRGGGETKRQRKARRAREAAGRAPFPFNRLLACNPESLAAGSSVLFSVAAVTHSMGVLSICGSFADPLHEAAEAEAEAAAAAATAAAAAAAEAAPAEEARAKRARH